MPAAKPPSKPSRTCPFCRSVMSELPDRVMVRFTPKADANPGKKFTRTHLLAECDLPRARTVAHICDGCGFLALFEV